MPQKLFQQADSRGLRAQVAQLLRKGYRVIRLPNDELRVGRYSYFPATGAIWDEATKLRQRGFYAFIDTIEGKRDASSSNSRSAGRGAREEATTGMQIVDLGLLGDENTSESDSLATQGLLLA